MGLFDRKQKQTVFRLCEDRTIRKEKVNVETGYIDNNKKFMSWYSIRKLFLPMLIGKMIVPVALITDRDSVPLDVFKVLSEDEKSELANPTPIAKAGLRDMINKTVTQQNNKIVAYTILLSVAIVFIMFAILFILVLMGRVDLGALF